MIFSEQAFSSFGRILEQMPFNYCFKMHGAYRYPVYPDWKAGLQRYKDLHILYVWGGQGFYNMTDGVRIPLEKGSLVFISSNMDHTAGSNIKNPLRIQGLRFGIYDRNSKDMTDELVAPCYFYMKPDNSQYYDDLTHRIHDIYHSRSSVYNDHVCSSIIYTLLYDMFSALKNFSPVKKRDKRVLTAKKYFDENPFIGTSISELADRLNISPRYLQRKFMEETGYTPKEYELNVKMRTARDLLVTENIRVKDVAGLLGYSDQYAFSRQFHRHFGFPPSRAYLGHFNREG